MNRIVAILLASALSACATFANPLTPTTINTVNASWGATLALGANYRDACATRIIPPSCRSIVINLQKAAIPVQAAVKAANQASIAGTVNAVSLAQAASDAINDYKTLQMQYGVK